MRSGNKDQIPTHTSLDDNACSNVRGVLEVFKIGHIIVGHAPQLFMGDKDGINGTCYNKNGENTLFRIDGGFSRAFKIFDNGDLVQILEILDDHIFNIITDQTINTHRKAPAIEINEQPMTNVAAIFSQNRITNTIKIKSSRKKKKNKVIVY